MILKNALLVVASFLPLLALAPQGTPPTSAAPVVFEWEGHLFGDAVMYTVLGEMTIPDYPDDSGEWTALVVTYACEYDSFSYVDNQSRETVPASFSSAYTSSTLQFLIRAQPWDTPFNYGLPWYAISAGTFLWPEVAPGEVYYGPNVQPSAAYDHYVKLKSWDYPQVVPGFKMDIVARHGALFDQWPDGAGPFGTVWDTKFKLTFRWGKFPS
jgi:hypothetical protein